MPTIRQAALAVALLSLTTAAWAELAPKVPVVVCPRVAEAPTMDGKIDPAEWAAAGCLSDFVRLGADELPDFPTRVYVMHTATSLFLGAQLFDEQPSELVARITERDGRVYEDDCLEFFIDTEAKRQDYAHFVVNSLGAKYDGFDLDASENFEWNVFAAVNETGWALEVELPFDQGIPPLEAEVWNIGVCRNAARVAEMSCWGRHVRGFHEPEVFGEMRFVSPMITARIDDVGDQARGDNLGLLTLQNLSGKAVTAKLHTVVMGSDRRNHYFGTVKQALAPRETRQVYLPYKIRRYEPAWMAFSLTDEQGNVAWRSAALPINLPDLAKPLDAIVASLASSWKYWSALQPSDEKALLGTTITSLQEQWQYIDEQIPEQAVGSPRLAALTLETRRLAEESALVSERVKAAAEGRFSED